MKRLGRWLRRRDDATSADVSEPELPSLELLGRVVERTLDAQQSRVASLNQRGGVLLGSSGVLIGLIAQDPTSLSGWDLASGVTALSAATFAGLLIYPITTDGIRPRRLLEHYAAEDAEVTRLAVLATLAYSYDEEEEIAGRKGKYLRRAIVLLLSSGVLLLVGVTVESDLVEQVTAVLRRLR